MMWNWLFVGLIVEMSTTAFMSQYGNASWMIYLVFFVVFLGGLVKLCVWQSTQYYATEWTLFDSVAGDKVFAKLDADGDGDITSEELDKLLMQKGWHHQFIATHLPGLNIGMGKFAIGFFTINSLKLIIYLCFMAPPFQSATSSMKSDMLCHLGLTVFTPHFPEEYAAFSDVFQMTPLSPLGFVFCAWTFLVTIIVVCAKAQEDRAANAAVLKKLADRDDVPEDEKEAVRFHHAASMKHGWTQSALLVPGLGIAAGLAAEVFCEAFVTAFTNLSLTESTTLSEDAGKKAATTALVVLVAELLIVIPMYCCPEAEEEEEEEGEGREVKAKEHGADGDGMEITMSAVGGSVTADGTNDAGEDESYVNKI